jgi:hypothetical protein
LFAYSVELVEVFAINTMAPFILNKRVIPLLLKVFVPLFTLVLYGNTDG